MEDKYFNDECDWCGQITKVKRYGKDKEYCYCDKCIKEIEREN